MTARLAFLAALLLAACDPAPTEAPKAPATSSPDVAAASNSVDVVEALWPSFKPDELPAVELEGSPPVAPREPGIARNCEAHSDCDQ